MTFLMSEIFYFRIDFSAAILQQCSVAPISRENRHDGQEEQVAHEIPTTIEATKDQLSNELTNYL